MLQFLCGLLCGGMTGVGVMALLAVGRDSEDL